MNIQEELNQLALSKNYNKLLTKLKPFLYKMVNKYNLNKCSELRKELKQSANIGLFNAMEKFDESKGNFWSFANTHIKKEIFIYLTNNTNIIRIPKNVQLDKNRESFPTENMYSLDSSIYEDDEPLYSMIEYEEEDNELDDTQEAYRRLVMKYLSSLKEQQQLIIKRYVIEEKTFNEIAEEVGVTKQTIHEQYKLAIKKLQKSFTK